MYNNKAMSKLNWGNCPFSFFPQIFNNIFKIKQPCNDTSQNIFFFYLSEKLSPLISSLCARIRDNIWYFLGNNGSFQGDPTTHPSI